MASERSIVIEQIYEKNQDLYKDLRPYASIEVMQARLYILKNLMNATPLSKRNHRRYIEMVHENLLLGQKYLIYIGSPTLPETKGVKRVLELGDLLYQDKKRRNEETPVKTRALKKNATILLLNYIFIDKSLDDLRSML